MTLRPLVEGLRLVDPEPLVRTVEETQPDFRIVLLSTERLARCRWFRYSYVRSDA